jgi:hypothetical protein
MPVGEIPISRWTLLLAGAADSPQQRKALRELCRVYRIPVLHYVQRFGIRNAEAAEDVTQDFFAAVLGGRGK